MSNPRALSLPRGWRRMPRPLPGTDPSRSSPSSLASSYSRKPRKVKLWCSSHSRNAAASFTSSGRIEGGSSARSSAATSSARLRIALQSSTVARTSPITRIRWLFSSTSVLRVGLAVHLRVDHRLRQLAFHGLRQDLPERAPLVPAHGHHGVDDQVHPDAAPVELHRHRIDQERHVVRHDLHRRVGRLPAVRLELGVVDAHLGCAVRPLAGEVEVPDRHPVEVQRVALGDLLHRQPAVVLADERLGQRAVARPQVVPHPGADLLDQRLLGVLDTHDCPSPSRVYASSQEPPVH